MTCFNSILNKSKVAKVSERKFLGFRLLIRNQKEGKQFKIGIYPESLKKFKDIVRALSTALNRGVSILEADKATIKVSSELERLLW